MTDLARCKFCNTELSFALPPDSSKDDLIYLCTRCLELTQRPQKPLRVVSEEQSHIRLVGKDEA